MFVVSGPSGYFITMKKYKKQTNNLYKAFLSSEKKEYKGITEYKFTVNNVDYMLNIAKSGLYSYIRFGILDKGTKYFDRSSFVSLSLAEEQPISTYIKRLFEYYAKYVTADDSIVDEVVEDIVKLYGIQ